MTRWMHRDPGEWDQPLDLFHPDATIEIAWFDGTARDFVRAARRMGASNLVTTNVIASPSITFRGDRAMAYLLEKSGLPLVGEFPTRGSKLETAMKTAGADWLDGTPAN